MSVPGTGDPCLNCGPVGSDAYMKCHSALAAKVGTVPACAQPGIKKNQTDIANAGIPLLSGLEQAVVNLQSVLGILSSPTTWVRVGLFAVAIIVVLIGFMVVASQQRDNSS